MNIQKISKLFLGMPISTRRSMKKTAVEKSRDTVPLRKCFGWRRWYRVYMVTGKCTV
jgi:hypothetical protein